MGIKVVGGHVGLPAKGHLIILSSPFRLPAPVECVRLSFLLFCLSPLFIEEYGGTADRADRTDRAWKDKSVVCADLSVVLSVGELKGSHLRVLSRLSLVATEVSWCQSQKECDRVTK